MNISGVDWRRPPSYQVARARLIGRQKYHTWRRQAVGQRRELVRELLLTLGWDRAGVLGEIAAQLNVFAATICRDRQALECW